jgi:N-acetylmuramoyl-L-alanine amidase
MARSVRHGGSILLCSREVTAAEALAAAGRCLLLLGLATLLVLRGVASNTAHPVAPQSPFEHAQRARQALESRPEDERTKRDYDRVLDLYRAIYHDNPASPKADASIFAVAELLAEQGRLLRDEKSLHDAIGQYEFLRREYPASHYRADALLAEGDIYLRDLGDRASAKSTLQSFLKQYPRTPQTAEVRKDLKEIHAGKITATNTTLAQVPAADASRPAARAARAEHSNTVLTAAIQSQSAEPPPQTSQPAAPPTNTPAPATPQKSRTGASTPPVLAPQVVPPPAAPPPTTTPPAMVATDLTPKQLPAPTSFSGLPRRKTKLVQVTGVRHWSTSVYTRVAIDLGDEVQYEAARVPDPDRIFFDLHGARLSPELIGRSIDVTDDGFLKRIRAAQFSNDVTRIVLDVSDVSDYSAFLLPNPYRLIIDIHGRKPGAPNRQQLAQSPPAAPPSAIQQNTFPRNPAPVVSDTKQRPASASYSPEIASSHPAPAQTKSQIATVVVANSTAPPSDRTSAQDIASLGRQPDRVQATNHPTTAPIAASVAGTTPAQQPELPKPTRNARRARPAENSQAPEVTAASVHEADPTAEGSRSMVRALGLKIGRIVVDAGHGGHDSGTLGPDGIEEKDVVLDVSLRLGKLLKQRLGADVIFTRSDDTFIPLETRTAIANKAQADLFVSVHANSSSDPSARGVETYYLNFTSSPESLELAARENAVSQQSIHQLSDLVKKIALHDKIDESREFASDVQKYLYEGLEQGNPGLKDRGVKQAPFVVLIGANMPSILAEISFLTNPDDAHQLRDPNYRQRIAESLYRGVARYVSGLSGVRLAENSTRLPER